MRKQAQLWLTVFLLLGASMAMAAGDFLTKTVKSSKGDVTVQWRINGENLDVKLSAPTKGWVGIGFNDRNGMKNAHFVMGAVDKTGKANFSERIGENDNRAPTDITKLGGKTHITNGTGKQEGGSTDLSFTIPLTASQKPYFNITKPEKVVILVAYSLSSDFGNQHNFRKFFTLNLKTGH